MTTPMEPSFSQHLALTLHIAAFAIWLGNLFAIASALVFRNDQTDATSRGMLGALGRRHGLVADIGATLTLLTGGWLLSFAPGFYFAQPWLHVKLTLVVVMLGGLLDWLDAHRFDPAQPDKVGYEVVDLATYLQETGRSPQPYADRPALEHARAVETRSAQQARGRVVTRVVARGEDEGVAVPL